ncbi:late embryogenesis abundant protein At5g17165-like [Rhododendron vialii]|uniref:late embryogenesis abundant protein At5g17165-like n=1 Tax=Rhododendron vialii TaxID=182163 RepID=UPI00265F6B56|nr:late embryogenesis abundant protein At5g17165-like [Rhododendron vialii]
MAANSQCRGLVGIGKRFVNQIRAGTSPDPIHSPFLALRRAVHVSVYDKNFDDQVRPSIVPDDVIQPGSDKYWSPHPQTGVFGPAAEHSQVAGGERSFHLSAAANGGEDSVLEQKAFFRPLEDLEKPIEL